MFKQSVFLFLFFFSCFSTFSQQKVTLSGYVRDAVSGENLTGATLLVKKKTQWGGVTNIYGFFSLTLPSGSYTLQVQYLGYERQEIPLNLPRAQNITISLKPGTTQISEVKITGERQDENVQSTQMGHIILPIEQIKTLPVLFGETDIIKTIQLLPGIKSGGEGSTGFYVRGGGSDQNLVLLDEAIVYNPGHLFNFFSVFNGDATRNTTVIKGNMPARYGGRLASVLAISMKEGNREKFSAEGGIGVIASRLTIQGPLLKNKASFMVAGRRTYLDVLTKPFFKNSAQGSIPYYFYDLNAKVNFTLGPNDRLYFSSYSGHDDGSFKLADNRFNAAFNWGNTTVTSRWNHLFSPKLFMNVSAIYNRYRFLFSSRFDNYESELDSGVKDYNIKVDFDYYPSVRHNLQYGVNYTNHTLTPRAGDATTDDGQTFDTERVTQKYAHEAAAYLSDDWQVTDKLGLSLGLRASVFRQIGPYQVYNYNAKGGVTYSVNFKTGASVKTYQALEPRFSFKYSLSSQTSIKAGITRNAQFLHLVSNSYTSLPLDIWVPSSLLVKPQLSWQYAAGYFRNLKENTYETSVEVYYKTLQNQLEYREGYAPAPRNKELEYEFVSGNGKAYGAEFFLRKNKGNLTGWVGYTWSRTNRTFPELNGGRKFPARYDRRHDASLVGTYKVNEQWTVGGSFVLSSGQPVTLPTQRYIIEGAAYFQYGVRNGFRMQPYHRLDLSATYQKNKSGWLRSSWTFAVYNAYSRKNPFFYYINNTGDPYQSTLALQAKKVTVFPFPIPSVTWNFTI